MYMCTISAREGDGRIDERDTCPASIPSDCDIHAVLSSLSLSPHKRGAGLASAMPARQHRSCFHRHLWGVLQGFLVVPKEGMASAGAWVLGQLARLRWFDAALLDDAGKYVFLLPMDQSGEKIVWGWGFG